MPEYLIFWPSTSQHEPFGFNTRGAVPTPPSPLALTSAGLGHDICPSFILTISTLLSFLAVSGGQSPFLQVFALAP